MYSTFGLIVMCLAFCFFGFTQGQEYEQEKHEKKASLNK